jgi:hypothetical protein
MKDVDRQTLTQIRQAGHLLCEGSRRTADLYGFRAPHWDHLRMSNPSESVFATVGTKGALSRDAARLMVIKLATPAKTWRRLKGESQLHVVEASHSTTVSSSRRRQYRAPPDHGVTHFPAPHRQSCRYPPLPAAFARNRTSGNAITPSMPATNWHLQSRACFAVLPDGRLHRNFPADAPHTQHDVA